MASDEQTLVADALATRQAAQSIVITDQASCEKAGEFLGAVKFRLKKVDEYFDGVVKSAHDHWKSLVAKRAEARKPYEAAEVEVKAALARWDASERARVEEERRIAEAEARRKAEDAALAEAAELEAQGDTEGATAALEAPVVAVVVPITSLPKSTHASFRNVYRVEVYDALALIRAVANGSAPFAAVIPNETYLNSIARATKGDVGIPGVRVVAERVVAGRAG